MTRRLATLLLLATAACSVDPDAFSVQGGQEYESAFQTASQAWCDATDGACCPHLDQDGPSSIRPATAEEFGDGDATTEPNGRCIHGGGEPTTILVLDTLSTERIASVILHELGHHCGCKDTQSRGLVMSQTTDYRAERLTAEEAACAK